MLSSYIRLYEGINPINTHFSSKPYDFRSKHYPKKEQPKKDIITFQDTFDAHELRKKGLTKKEIQAKMGLTSDQMKVIFKEATEDELDVIRDSSMKEFESPYALGEKVGFRAGDQIVPAEIFCVRFEPSAIYYDLIMNGTVVENVSGVMICPNDHV